jgi:hypothetical protein
MNELMIYGGGLFWLRDGSLGYTYIICSAHSSYAYARMQCRNLDLELGLIRQCIIKSNQWKILRYPLVCRFEVWDC